MLINLAALFFFGSTPGIAGQHDLRLYTCMWLCRRLLRIFTTQEMSTALNPDNGENQILT